MDQQQPIDVHRRILVVDDTPSIHDDFRKVLGIIPQNERVKELESALFDDEDEEPREEEYCHMPVYQIDSAYQGREALEKVLRADEEGKPYALLYVDIRMPPGWDGIETIKRIWQAAPYTEVVICSAYSDYTWNQIVASLGNTDNLIFLKKPFNAIVLRQITLLLTQKWLQGYKARDQVSQLKDQVTNRAEKLNDLVEKMGGKTETSSSPYKIEITEGNIKFISRLVLRYFENGFKSVLSEYPEISWDETVEDLSKWSDVHIDELTDTVQRACREAIRLEPNLSRRRDLFGRVLMRYIFISSAPPAKWKARFKRYYLKPFLKAVKDVFGKDRYDYFNGVLKSTLLNHCIIRDLQDAEIDWPEFFNQKTVSIMMRKTFLIKNHVDQGDDERATFIDAVNHYAGLTNTEPFDEYDLKMAFACWDIE